MIRWCVECGTQLGDEDCPCQVPAFVQEARDRTRRLHNEEMAREAAAVAPLMTDGKRQVEVGDFFVCSWGYDQTNTDFYEVLDVTPSGKSVKIRRVQTCTLRENGSSSYVAPLPGTATVHGGEIMTKRLQDGWKGDPFIRIASYAIAQLWDCKPQYETASGWGH